MVENVREYRPELLSRRGELIAWLSAFFVAIGWFILRLKHYPITPALSVVGIFLLISAVSISLGNWMDRKTLIRLDEHGIHYENGLRRIQMSWPEIREVHVSPVSWGRKVQVIGQKGYFAFRTLGEVRVGGELKGRMGFAQGDQILDQIVANSQLEMLVRPDGGIDYHRNRA